MGLLELFGKGPMTDKKVEKVAKLACNPYAQPDVRMREMQRLLEEGTEVALRGLLKRFAANANGPIADEDEKKWLEDALVDVGASVSKPLQAYIRSEKQLTYALRSYRRLSGDAEGVRFFIEILESYGPEDYRSNEAKLQLIWQLSENLSDARVVPALVPFLTDHGDDVRWAVMDLLERGADENLLDDSTQASVCERLGELLADSSTGPRILKRSAGIFAARHWPVPEGVEGLSKLLDDDYFIDKKRFLRKRAKRS